ncbi:MAG: hypothetical protein LC648_09300, partial [Novosphingobium sp.]|nr:hypothetical protein [Novosphingobium sp.]
IAGLAIGAALADGRRGRYYDGYDGYYDDRPYRGSYYYPRSTYYYPRYNRYDYDGYYYDRRRYRYRYERKHRKWHRRHDRRW